MYCVREGMVAQMDLERYASTPFGEARRTPGPHGYVAYFPAPIPRALELPASTVRLLADAEGALGQGLGERFTQRRGAHAASASGSRGGAVLTQSP